MNFHNFKAKHKNLSFVFVAIVLVFSVAFTIFMVASAINKFKEGKYIGQDVISKNTITVSATGEVYAKPDLALVDFSVTTEAKTADEAMKENSQNMNVVIEVIKNLGVEAKDLKTTTFRINPRYEWHTDKGDELSYYHPEGTRVLAGYEVFQTLHVKIRDLDKIGEIIKEATAVGSNQVGGLQFTIDDQDELKAQARKQAIKKAKVKAKLLASQLGVNLGRITNFNEGGAIPKYYSTMEAMGRGGDMEAVIPSIEVGENKIEVAVNITYEIN